MDQPLPLDDVGASRFRLMGALYAAIQDMTEAEIEALFRCADAIKVARSKGPAEVIQLPARRRR